MTGRERKTLPIFAVVRTLVQTQPALVKYLLSGQHFQQFNQFSETTAGTILFSETHERALLDEL